MKKKFISKLLVLAMSVSLLSGVSQPVLAEAADSQNATISGTLLAADGTALAKKTITLRERSAKDGGGRYTVTTDAQGKYSKEVPAGVYQVVGIPYDFNQDKEQGISEPQNVCAVAQIVTLDDGQAVTQDLQVPSPVTVPNGEFPSGNKDKPVIDGWTIDPDSTGIKYNTNGKHSGNGYLNTWSSQAFKFNVHQQLDKLEKGTYVVNFSVETSLVESDEAYVYVKDVAGNMLAKEEIRSNYDSKEKVSRYEVFGLTVEVGDVPIVVGVFGDCSASQWVNVDEFRMGRLPDAPEIYTKAQLKTLLDDAETYDAKDFTKASFDNLTTAKTDAQTVYDKASAADNEITQAYKALQAAIESLVPAKKEGDANIQNDVFWRDTDVQ